MSGRKQEAAMRTINLRQVLALLRVVSIEKIERAMSAMDDDGITCETCLDDEWWPANGFSQAEREAICAFIGCPTEPPVH